LQTVPPLSREILAQHLSVPPLRLLTG